MTENNSNPSADRGTQTLLQDDSLSGRKKYGMLAVGNTSLWALLRYELTTGLFASMSGALGFACRKAFYPGLLARMGKGTHIGRNVTLRGASRIELGKNLFIDDNVTLDARGEKARIVIGDNVILSRNSVLRTRAETLEIGAGSVLGSNCVVATDSQVHIGRDVLIAAYSYICGAGSHAYAQRDVPIIEQGVEAQGGVRIGDGAWIGARCTLMDGSSVGAGSILGAHSLVNSDLPEMKICFGSPAKVVRDRP